ncbi:MAG: nicotinamide mononucleotide transporter [Clostridia bacterium]|nr:nicotinamide mononucleotide transporter [Clostridia bacterium]
MEKGKIKNIIDYILLGVAFVAILVLGIIEKQDVIKIIPALFGLIVYMLASKAFRIAYLFGAINSAIYSVGYFMMGLYGNAFVNLCLYVPIQIFTFIQWSKQKYKQATVFKKLPVKFELLLFAGATVAWGLCWFILTLIPGSSSVPAFDAIGTVLGPITAVTTMFALMETIGYELIATGSNVIMWLILVISSALRGEGIADITYLITTCFTLYCQICKTFTWIKLYKEQKNNTDQVIDTAIESDEETA